MMISEELPKDGETVAVPAAQSLEPFFTPGQGAWRAGSGEMDIIQCHIDRGPRLCLAEAYAA